MYREIQRAQPADPRWWGKSAALFGAPPPPGAARTLRIPMTVRRFRVAKLSWPLRRALLALLEGMHPDALAEDMLRHRSYWVWIGEHLHPHEHAKRFPDVARAFLIVRGRRGPRVRALPRRAGRRVPRVPLGVPDEAADARARARARARADAGADAALRPDRPVLAALYRGDLDLPEGSTCYALFQERAGATIAASSLIAPPPTP